MDKPSWFVAVLLGSFAGLMALHLTLLAMGTQRCLSYGATLAARLRALPPDSPMQKALHDEVIENGTRCVRLVDDLQKASDNYQSTILALLGGAGLSAGVSVASSKRDD
jgi:hypothetical protein